VTCSYPRCLRRRRLQAGIRAMSSKRSAYETDAAAFRAARKAAAAAAGAGGLRLNHAALAAAGAAVRDTDTKMGEIEGRLRAFADLPPVCV
jgi:hypothetical protein